MASSPFDANFCFPVRELENETIKLTPFIPDIHAIPFMEATRDHPELYDKMIYGPWHDLQSFKDEFILARFHKASTDVLFAILDKTRNHAFAGIVGYTSASLPNSSVEIGSMIVFPAFQRTHVASVTIGLMLQYALDIPTDQPFSASSPPTNAFTNTGNLEPPVNALGLWRVQWHAQAVNSVSIRAAERMGFELEGISRWAKALPPTKTGLPFPSGTRRRKENEMVGLHVATLAVCWDDWDAGIREHVEEAMKLRVAAASVIS